MRPASPNRVQSAGPSLLPGLVATAPGQRLTAAAIMLSAGSRLAQNGSAYDRAYPWLDTLLTVLAPRTPADTMSPRQQVRVSASFWYGLSSVLTLQVPYKRMIDSKNCEEAKLINERLVPTRASL